MRPLLAAVVFLAAAPAFAKPGDPVPPTSEETRDVIAKYAPKVAILSREIGANPDILNHPEELTALVMSRVPDPKFQHAFINMMLSQYGNNSGGTTTPALPDKTGPTTAAPGKPALDENVLRV